MKDNANANDSDRFLWSDNQVYLTGSVCDVCVYNNPENKTVCASYPEGKPLDIRWSRCTCKHLKI